MGTMTNDETYNGYANRETWAFNLHWQNDQGLYHATLDTATEAMRQTKYDVDGWGDYALGEHVVEFWRDTIDAERRLFTDGVAQDQVLAMFEREVGSWWRIDYAEVGAAVRESLSVEGE